MSGCFSPLLIYSVILESADTSVPSAGSVLVAFPLSTSLLYSLVTVMFLLVKPCLISAFLAASSSIPSTLWIMIFSGPELITTLITVFFLTFFPAFVFCSIIVPAALSDAFSDSTSSFSCFFSHIVSATFCGCPTRLGTSISLETEI